MTNSDRISFNESKRKFNDASPHRSNNQDEYVRAAKEADKQGIKPKSENRSCSWQNITQAFLKCCGFKGAEKIVLEETTEGDVKRTSIRSLDRRGEWWNRPDHFTLATDSIDTDRIYFALKRDLMKWDRFQENWKKVLERLEQPSGWDEAEPSISKSELDRIGDAYRLAYEEDDGSHHAFERLQKAQKAWDEALKRNNPNLECLQDKTQVTRIELEHAGLVLGQALRRSEDGTQNLQEDMSLHFDQCKTAYKEMLQARNVLEGSQEATDEKWLRIGKGGAHTEKDVRDMFWHDARWAMRNTFLAKELLDSEKQKEILARSEHTLSRLREMYDEAKNQLDSSSDISDSTDKRATDGKFPQISEEVRKNLVDALNNRVLEAEAAMGYGDISEAGKIAEAARQLEEQDKIFERYINAKSKPEEDFEQIEKDTQTFVFTGIDQSSMKISWENGEGVMLPKLSLEGKTPQEHIDTLRTMDPTSQAYQAYYHNLAEAMATMFYEYGFTTLGIPEEDTYFYDEVTREDIKGLVDSHLQSKLESHDS